METVTSIDKEMVPLSSRRKMRDWSFCQICQRIMLCVFQLACGHLTCGACKKKLEDCGHAVCPDNPNCLSMDISLSPKIFEDRFQSREIQNFPTECINAQFGCPWTGVLADYTSHYEECKWKHEGSVSFEDAYSEDVYQLKLKGFQPPSIEHMISCQTPPSVTPSMGHPCSRKNGPTPSKIQDNFELEGSKSLLPCPFTEVGCPEDREQTIEDLRSHARIGSEIHLDLLLRDHLSLRKICMDSKFRSYEDAINRVDSDLRALSKSHEMKSHEIDKRYIELNEKVDQVASGKRKNTREDVTARLDDIEAMLACFQDDRMSGTASRSFEQRLNAAEFAIEQLRSTAQKPTNPIVKLESQLKFKDSRIESLEAQLGMGEMTSFDGILIWKVTDFLKKRRDAITKRNTFTLSPPFFSGRRGYKMCMRLYLNGDGSGKGTHISIFFTILKGPYDAILPWPFKQVVKLSLLAQNGGQNAEDSFRPDHTSVSFQRPQKESNISSGCPMFLSLSSLDSGGFIQDDCIFLKARVEEFSL